MTYMHQAWLVFNEFCGPVSPIPMINNLIYISSNLLFTKGYNVHERNLPRYGQLEWNSRWK
jgi:hypothetical protein